MARPSAESTENDPGAVALRAFVRARRAKDEPAMRRAWQEFVATEWTRIKTIVATWKHDALPGGRVPYEAREDVVQDALARLLPYLGLKGSSIGEAKNMVRSHTVFALLEYVRRSTGDDMGTGGSLDDPGPDGDGEGPAALKAQVEHARQRIDGLEQAALRADFDAAIRKVDENKREVVVLRLAGVPGNEVAERLGLTRANVDQLNSRGLAQLREALRDGP